MEDLTQEIILFRIPTYESSVVVFGIPVQAPEEHLYEIFRSAGVINQIALFDGNDDGKRFAFVKYYSTTAAQLVLSWTDATISGSKLKIEPMKARPPSAYTELTISQSIELANFYLGFDGWSTRIVSHQHMDNPSQESRPPIELNEQTNFIKCQQKVSVELKLKTGESLVCEGVGICEEKNPGLAVANSKKAAASDAIKRCFSQLALVILKDGRVIPQFFQLPKSADESENPEDSSGSCPVDFMFSEFSASGKDVTFANIEIRTYEEFPQEEEFLSREGDFGLMGELAESV